MTDEEKKAQEIQEQAEREAKEKAAKESEEKTDEGKEQPASTPEGKEDSGDKSPLEEARALDQSIKEGAEKMQKLLEKNEKVFADAALAGKGFATKPTGPQFTDEEKASRSRIKQIADASGASWGKKYE